MPDNPGGWSIILHGGAKSIAPWDRKDNREGCRTASEIGAAILREGGSARIAAEAVIRSLEDDPTFNAGTGSVCNRSGDLEMDAAIMDGTTLNVGAVAALKGVRNPISVATRLLQEAPVLLVGEGAAQFAEESGLRSGDVAKQFETVPNRSSDHDTVGCVIRDQHGHFAAATSTGGLTGQWVGRVGDAPIPGSGLYADDMLGGTALSGDGESILRTFLASRIMVALESNSAQRAADLAIGRLPRVGGEAGAIVIDREGRFGVAHNSEDFALALHADWLPAPRVATHQDEIRDILG